MDKEMKKKLTKEDDKKPSSDMATDAKVKALNELRNLSSSMMQDDLKGRMSKKVTVAAPDTEGLKEGLDIAKKTVDKVEKSPEELSNMKPNEEAEEAMEDYEDDISDLVENCESPEEIDELIKKLQEKKSAMK